MAQAPTPMGLGVALRERGGIRGIATEDDVAGLLEADGVEVEPRWGFRSARLRAMHIAGTIYLSARLDRPWRLALTAHEYAHFRLHPGNHLYLAVGQAEHLRHREEREAQLFAGTLLLGCPYGDGFDAVLAEASADQRLPDSFMLSFMHAVTLHARRLTDASG